ncbi:MAG: DUF2442 domain-containing protein [Planctomycetota bacterium]
MRIIDASAKANFQVHLTFADGQTGTADLADLAGTGVFKAWQDLSVFQKVSIDPLGGLRWPGDLDLCPDMLYQRITGQLPADTQAGASAHA